MGASFIKNIAFLLLTSLVKIPLDVLGRWVIAHNYTDQANWSTVVVNFTLLACAFVWAKIVNTQTIKDMSGIIGTEEANKLITTAISMPQGATIEDVKAVASSDKGTK